MERRQGYENQAAHPDYDVIDRASTVERREYWENKASLTPKADWSGNLISLLEDSRDFFNLNEKGARWADFLSRLDIDVLNFDQNSVDQLYDRYFPSPDRQSQIKTFVDDIIGSHESPEVVQQNLDVISWLANIFGSHSAEAVASLVEEQTKSAETPATPEEPENPEDPYSIADKLINYKTGEVRDEQVDLSKSFPRLIERVGEMVEQGHQVFQSQEPKLVLSDVAWAMIDRVASEANRRDKELGFAVHGVWLTTNDGKHILVGSHIVPSMDYTTAQQTVTNVDPALHRQVAPKLARNTNLTDYFYQVTGFRNGDMVGNCHIHQEPLGDRWRIQPSSQDYETVERIVNAQQGAPHVWAVVTKHSDDLGMKFFFSHLKEDGEIEHLQIPVFTESELEEFTSQAA